ncbi:head-tail joining protein [Sphingopyxis sp.]|uniref:head-tail joining protein n=1 Tax=Sphingopyxis sp. TaxID=1908224 RepID=UPI004035F133
MDAFFDPDEFGMEAAIETDAGATRTFNGIFDDPYLNAQLGEYDMDTSRPRFLAKETDLAGIQRGDAVTIRQRNKAGAIISAKQYDVLAGPKSTGDGMAVLELAEA